MKNLLFIILILSAVLLVSCGDNKSSNPSTTLTEDDLNALKKISPAEARAIEKAFPGSNLETIIANHSAQILTNPTGDVPVDLVTVSALVLATPTGVLETDITTLSATLLNTPTGVIETDIATLSASLLNAPSGILRSDISLLAFYTVNVPSANLETDLFVVASKLGGIPFPLEVQVDNLLSVLNALSAVGWSASSPGAGQTFNGGNFNTIEEFVIYLSTL